MCWFGSDAAINLHSNLRYQKHEWSKIQNKIFASKIVIKAQYLSNCTWLHSIYAFDTAENVNHDPDSAMT